MSGLVLFAVGALLGYTFLDDIVRAVGGEYSNADFGVLWVVLIGGSIWAASSGNSALLGLPIGALLGWATNSCSPSRLVTPGSLSAELPGLESADLHPKGAYPLRDDIVRAPAEEGPKYRMTYKGRDCIVEDRRELIASLSGSRTVSVLYPDGVKLNYKVTTEVPTYVHEISDLIDSPPSE